MSNLPRLGRSWQRFSSLPRPPTASRPEVLQPPTTAAEPEVYRPALPTTDVLQASPIKERSPRLASPVRKPPSPPSSPKYSAPPAVATTSPRKPVSPTVKYDRSGERRTTATSSPKILKPTQTQISPPLSPPKNKQPAVAAAAPLSPLRLPRSEARYEPEHTIRSRSPPEVEQKKVLYQKTTEKTTKTDHRQPENISGEGQQKQKQQQQQQQSDVINIKGENVGAVMHITQSSDGKEIHKKIPKASDEKTNESTTSNNVPGKSFMNTNFQGVNNSILYNSSLSHRDPGLHLSFSKNPNPNT